MGVKRYTQSARRVVLIRAPAALLALALACAPVGRSAAVEGRRLPGRSDRAACVVGFRVLGEIPGSDAWALSSPEALAVDHRGDILIADTGNHRVLVVAETGEIVAEFGGYGWSEGLFDTPSDLAIYAGFYTYVLDEGNRRVQRFNVDGDFVDVVVDSDEAGSPVSLAVGQAGDLLLVDADSQTVLVRSQFDEPLAAIGRFGGGEGGLVSPRGVAWGPSRSVAVADPERGAVEVFDEFGSRLFALGAADTLLPADVLFDPGGSPILNDLGRARVLAYPPRGGAPTASFEGGETFVPTALAIDLEGRLLVLDGERGRILLIEMIHGKCPSDR